MATDDCNLHQQSITQFACSVCVCVWCLGVCVSACMHVCVRVCVYMPETECVGRLWLCWNRLPSELLIRVRLQI